MGGERRKIKYKYLHRASLNLEHARRQERLEHLVEQTGRTTANRLLCELIDAAAALAVVGQLETFLAAARKVEAAPAEGDGLTPAGALRVPVE